MSKSKEELNKLKNEVEALNEKLNGLSPEELEQVTGGVMPIIFASKLYALPIEPGEHMGFEPGSSESRSK